MLLHTRIQTWKGIIVLRQLRTFVIDQYVLCWSILRYRIRVHKIVYGCGGLSKKKYQSSLILYCRKPILCQNIAKELRERPFNLKGRRGGVMVFFLKKYSDSQCCWKNILILVEGEKKIIWFRVFVILPNFKFWKQILRLARQKKNILTLVLSEKKIMNETKNHNPSPSPPLSS